MRRQIMRLAGAAALAAAPLTGLALAQTASSPNAATSFVTQQPANEWLARVFIGQAVHNSAGEIVGDVNDLVFDRQGRISTVVIGVGGFLGIGEKSVGVRFDALTFNVGKNGERVIVVALSKQDLMQAPELQGHRKDHLRQGEGQGQRSGPPGRGQSGRAEGPGCPEDRGYAQGRADKAVTVEARARRQVRA